MKKGDLAIIGPYPPQFGGISIHILRLGTLLDSRGIPYKIYNTSSRAEVPGKVVSILKWRSVRALWYAISGREACVYLHVQRLGLWLLGAFMQRFRGKRFMLCLHNMNIHNWCVTSAWKRWLIQWVVCNTYALVCVNQRVYRSVLDLGVSRDRVFYLPSFLPPGPESTRKSDVCQEVWAAMEGRHPLIAANGKVAWHDGQDLYGLDLLLELAVRLKPNYPNLKIVVCFWDHKPEDQPYLDKLIALAREKGVDGNLCFNTRQGPFIPVLAEADVFVRPTNTDGDATSIREALALGVPSVVSDVVERPEGSLLFRTRDLDDFEEKVRQVLSKTGPNQGTRTFVVSEEDKQRIELQVTLIRSLLSGQLPD
ncbi:MAG TPA: glycosyltransferase family 4 protein [Candidatus Sumerlaeota bacterium]|nr:glycosyltransferase family 4 protein [Candidatus Sumerlaeota bacterium]HPS00255.1 glycosyltransferase family 4 protein [Candidatus Sumerlaeota bacterium]